MAKQNPKKKKKFFVVLLAHISTNCEWQNKTKQNFLITIPFLQESKQWMVKKKMKKKEFLFSELYVTWSFWI